MTFHVKWGTAWVTPASGDLHLKWNAGAPWVNPARVRIRWGGGWVDTGYLGYPGMPRNLSIERWTYESITVGWDLPSSGAAVEQYNAQLLSEQGAVISNTLRTTRNVQWNVSENTRYRIRVRSVGASGLYSGFTSELRIDIGRAARQVAKVVTRTRPWQHSKTVDMYRDEIVGNKIPADVDVTRLIVDLRATFSTSQVNNGSSRTIYYVRDGVQMWNTGIKPNPWNENVAFDQHTPGIHGLVLRGEGWSNRGVSTGWRLTGSITSKGNETYQDTVYDTVPAVPNTYW